MNNFENKKITVMGLGLHGGGLGVAKFLAGRGAKLVITDLKTDKELRPSISKLKKYDKQIEYVLGRHREEDFKKTDLVIKNPGVPKNNRFLKIARKNKVKIETDIGLFSKLCPAEIIGVTGTRGKSTTASLIHHILKQENKAAVLGGNIRFSPLLALGKIKKKTPVVLELSSWQLEDAVAARRSPSVAVVTSFYPDHLDRHRTMEEYLRAKANIFRFQKKHDFLILNWDQPALRRLKAQAKGQIYFFSKNKKVKGAYWQRGKLYLATGHQPPATSRIITAGKLRIKGEHNLANAAAAALAASLFGAKLTSIKKGLKSFPGLADRQEIVGKVRGVAFINDTTSTIPDSTIIALNTIKGKIVLIAGGASKKLDYGALVKTISKRVKRLILLKGPASDEILAALKQLRLPKKIPVNIADNMRQAVKLANQSAKSGETVLLSPAAASFGMFVNEFDRGRQFKQAVKKLR